MASTRSKARKRALEALYAADVRRIEPVEALAEKEAAAETPLNPYARTLVEGVTAHRVEIDRVLAEHAQDWPLARMPAVDRNVLRIGVFELLWSDPTDPVPAAVAVSEAVALVKELSTDSSPSFVNGLLGRVQQLAPAHQHPDAAEPA